MVVGGGEAAFIHLMDTHATQSANGARPILHQRGVRGRELRHSDLLMHHLFKLKTRKGDDCIGREVFRVARPLPLKEILIHFGGKFARDVVAMATSTL